MLNDQDAAASLGNCPGQQLSEMLRLAAVEPGGRLVQEQQAVGTGQGASELDQSTLAGGQTPGDVVGEVPDTAPVDRFVRHGPDRLALRRPGHDLGDDVRSREAGFPAQGDVVCH